MSRRRCNHSARMPAAGFRAKAMVADEMGNAIRAIQTAIDVVNAARTPKELMAATSGYELTMRLHIDALRMITHDA